MRTALRGCRVAAARIVPHAFKKHALHASIAQCLNFEDWKPFHRGFKTSTASYGDVIPFNLPDIGEGIAEVEIVQWFVKAGDKVEQFDKLLEVQSDKATVEITSRYDGVIKSTHYNAGDIAPTGSALLDIELEGDSEEISSIARSTSESAQPEKEQPSSASVENVRASSSSKKALATPAVRRIAREHDVSLEDVPATGKDGRVLKGDILAFLSGKTKGVQPSLHQTGTVAQTVSGPQDTRQPIRGMQRAMVKSMLASWAVPHFGYCDEVQMDGAMRLRAQLKPLAESRGLKLSYMPLIIKATSLALKQYPELNASVSDDQTELILRGAHNIGIAIDSPKGLIVPNIKNCQDRSVFEIAEELLRLQGLATEGKLSESDLNDGTFSLSNIGAIGGTYASPVIMMPQVAIGAIGKMQRVPRFDVDGSIVPAHIMRISWSADHRVVDGASMARFSNLWRNYLEDPLAMIADLK